ncbi:MAG: hypothetical protein MN733_40725 [Nitrososphaera sp.]|nr:hypothetical protein [Nitrososphaera sp.]
MTSESDANGKNLNVQTARGSMQESGLDTWVLSFYRLLHLWRVRRFFPVDSWLTILVNGWHFKQE